MPDLKSAPQKPGSLAPGKPGAPPPGLAGPKKVVVEAYSFRRHGVAHIRQAAIVFGAIFLLSAALVTAGHVMLSKTVPRTAEARQSQAAARERLVQAETERIEIRDFQPKFEQLRTRGFFGPEDRLVMLEAIAAIARQRSLLPIRYEFAPQQVVALDPALLAPPLELHASTVAVRLGLLHEMDLVHFLADLKARAFFTVKECVLVSQDGASSSAPSARVAADCTLFWLSVGEVAPVVADPAAGG